MLIKIERDTLKKASPPRASLRIPLASVKVSCKRRSLVMIMGRDDDSGFGFEDNKVNEEEEKDGSDNNDDDDDDVS